MNKCVLILKGKREELLESNRKYRKIWNLIQRNDSKMSDEQRACVAFERSFLVRHIRKYFAVLNSIKEEGELWSS